jgi:hypothetical protein
VLIAGTLAGVVAFFLMLSLALDYPFGGGLAIGPEALERVPRTSDPR